MQAETASGLASIPFERGEFRLAINNVPAQICPNCGEAYVDEDVTIQLLQDAEKIFDEGVREDVIEF
jgi:YgiT-type zinc finger domain-containing protein